MVCELQFVTSYEILTVNLSPGENARVGMVMGHLGLGNVLPLPEALL